MVRRNTTQYFCFLFLNDLNNPQHIKIEVNSQVVNIILNRPEKRNALNSQMINEIQKSNMASETSKKFCPPKIE